MSSPLASRTSSSSIVAVRAGAGSVVGLGGSAREQGKTLDIAARSLAEHLAAGSTVASVLAERALDRHWEGLFEYAALRVGASEATRLLYALESELEKGRDTLADEARPRVALFRRMRALVAGARALPLHSDAVYWPVPEATRTGYAQLRASLSERERDVVELCFTRRLSDDDAAAVLDLDVTEIKRACIVALGLARRVFPRRAPSRDGSYEGVWLEAFALDPEVVRVPRRTSRRPVLERGRVVGGRYEVEALLGAGAFADVYRARDCVVTDHVVALKILRTRAADERSVQAALRELEVIASVFHPSIVQLNDHGWHDGHLWFVMPLYRGETLATRLTRGPLTRGEARAIFEPLAEALAAMHRAGVQHQDVKPENVFLATLDLDATSGPPHRILPVLLDLGVASKDAELVLAGTPAYFAPEVAARFLGVPDPPPVGPKADVFALALTLKRALDPALREHIPGGAVDAFVAFRALHAPEPPARRELRDLGPHFARWLAQSPDARPSAEEFRRELSVLTRPAERTARRLSVLRWVLPVSFAVCALFGAVVYVLGHEASLRKLEAAEAREHAAQATQRAQTIFASLTEQEARRRELERDVARLEQEYQTSQLTRDELASRLARTEGELTVVGERDRTQSARLKQQAESLAELEAEHETLRDKLASAEARAAELREELGRERARSGEREAESERLRVEAAQVAVELEGARVRIRDLEERMAGLADKTAARLDRTLHPDAL